MVLIMVATAFNGLIYKITIEFFTCSMGNKHKNIETMCIPFVYMAYNRNSNAFLFVKLLQMESLECGGYANNYMRTVCILLLYN